MKKILALVLCLMLALAGTAIAAETTKTEEFPAVVEDVSYEAFLGVWELESVVIDGLGIPAEELMEELIVVIDHDNYMVGDETGFSDALPCSLEGHELLMPMHDWVGTIRSDNSLCLADSESEMWFRWVCADESQYNAEQGISVIYIEDLLYALPSFVSGAAPEGYPGVWYLTGITESGEYVSAQENGLIIPLYLMEDGTAALVMNGEPMFIHWGDDHGYLYIADPTGAGDDLFITMTQEQDEPQLGLETYNEDGSLATGMYFTQAAPEGAEELPTPVFPRYEHKPEGAELSYFEVRGNVELADFEGSWEMLTFTSEYGTYTAEELDAELYVYFTADGSYTVYESDKITTGAGELDGYALPMEEFLSSAMLCTDGRMCMMGDDMIIMFAWCGYENIIEDMVS